MELSIHPKCLSRPDVYAVYVCQLDAINYTTIRLVIPQFV